MTNDEGRPNVRMPNAARVKRLVFGFCHSLVIRHSSFVIPLATLFLTTCGKPAAPIRVDRDEPVEVVLPPKGAYTGAFIDFGDEEDDVSLEGIEEFEGMV